MAQGGQQFGGQQGGPFGRMPLGNGGGGGIPQQGYGNLLGHNPLQGQRPGMGGPGGMASGGQFGRPGMPGGGVGYGGELHGPQFGGPGQTSMPPGMPPQFPPGMMHAQGMGSPGGMQSGGPTSSYSQGGFGPDAIHQMFSQFTGGQLPPGNQPGMAGYQQGMPGAGITLR